MSAITIRKLPDDAKQRLRMRAAANGRSMEAEARDILLSALDEERGADSWVERLMEAARRYGGEEGVVLEIPDLGSADYPDLSRWPQSEDE